VPRDAVATFVADSWHATGRNRSLFPLARRRAVSAGDRRLALRSSGNERTGPAWTTDVSEASWIGERLSRSDTLPSVVPAEFDAYARVLHPVEEPCLAAERLLHPEFRCLISERLVRWSEVADWSGIQLRRDAQFHSVALPPARSEDPAPWQRPFARTGASYPSGHPRRPFGEDVASSSPWMNMHALSAICVTAPKTRHAAPT
jgi:hypothetical protein